MDCLRNSTIVPFTSSAHGEGDYLRWEGSLSRGQKVRHKKTAKRRFLESRFLYFMYIVAILLFTTAARRLFTRVARPLGLRKRHTPERPSPFLYRCCHTGRNRWQYQAVRAMPCSQRHYRWPAELGCL